MKNNYYFKAILRILKNNDVYNCKLSIDFLVEIKSIFNNFSYELPHLIFEQIYKGSIRSQLNDEYNLYILETYLSDLKKGAKEKYNAIIENESDNELKNAIIEGKLYSFFRKKFKFRDECVDNIIKEYCYKII